VSWAIKRCDTRTGFSTLSGFRSYGERSFARQITDALLDSGNRVSNPPWIICTGRLCHGRNDLKQLADNNFKVVHALTQGGEVHVTRLVLALLELTLALDRFFGQLNLTHQQLNALLLVPHERPGADAWIRREVALPPTR
jgi:hypothetical protein